MPTPLKRKYSRDWTRNELNEHENNVAIEIIYLTLFFFCFWKWVLNNSLQFDKSFALLLSFLSGVLTLILLISKSKRVTQLLIVECMKVS